MKGHFREVVGSPPLGTVTLDWCRQQPHLTGPAYQEVVLHDLYRSLPTQIILIMGVSHYWTNLYLVLLYRK